MVATMIKDPMKCLYSYKVRIYQRSRNSDGEKVQQYVARRVEMAKKYGEERFEPAETHFLDYEKLTIQK